MDGGAGGASRRRATNQLIIQAAAVSRATLPYVHAWQTNTLPPPPAFFFPRLPLYVSLSHLFSRSPLLSSSQPRFFHLQFFPSVPFLLSSKKPQSPPPNPHENRLVYLPLLLICSPPHCQHNIHPFSSLRLYSFTADVLCFIFSLPVSLILASSHFLPPPPVNTDPPSSLCFASALHFFNFLFLPLLPLTLSLFLFHLFLPFFPVNTLVFTPPPSPRARGSKVGVFVQ